MIHQIALSFASVLMLGSSQAATQAPAGQAPAQTAPAQAAPAQPASAQTAPEPSTGRLGKIEAAVAHPGRTTANVARDRYRNPAATLNFFEVDPDDTVVEIWPGGGWYTEILAPYLAAGGGKLYAAAPDWGRSGLQKLQQADAKLYGSIETIDFPAFDVAAKRFPDGTADVVLTFRNVHNWRMGYRRDDKQD